MKKEASAIGVILLLVSPMLALQVGTTIAGPVLPIAYIYSSWGMGTMQDEMSYLGSLNSSKYSFVWYNDANIADLWSNLESYRALLIEEDTFYEDGSWSQYGGPIYASFRTHGEQLASWVTNGGGIFTSGENDLSRTQAWNWLPLGMQVTSDDSGQTSNVHIIYNSSLYWKPNLITNAYLSGGHTHAYFTSWDQGYLVTVRRDDNNMPIELFGVFGIGVIVVSHIEAEVMIPAWEYMQNQLDYITPGYPPWVLTVTQPLEGSVFTAGNAVTIIATIVNNDTENLGTGATVTANTPSGTLLIFSEASVGVYSAMYVIQPIDPLGSWTINAVGIIGGKYPKDSVTVEVAPQGVHDVAVSKVQRSKTVVGQGYSTNITVTGANLGSYAETFDVSLYASSEQAMSEVGLVGYWKSDEGSGTIASDSSGNNNHGTISGAVWTGGRIGSALQFDGFDDYVQVPDSASLNITNDAISIAAWVKMLGDGTSNGVIVCKQAPAGASDASYSLDVYPSSHAPVGRHVEFAVNAGGGWKAFVSTSALNLSTWNHIIGTYDGSKVGIFINGMLDAEYTLAGNIVPKSGPLYIGHEDSWSPGEYFNGTIDEVKIYNRTLSADEIWAEYTNASLVGYWKFDEGIGTTAQDSSGNNNHGAIYGATWTNGRVENALQFDGVNDYADCGNDKTLNMTDNLTIVTWVRFNSIPAALSALVSKDEGWYDQKKWIFGYVQNFVGISNALVFHINSPIGDSDWLASSTFTPTMNKWYHVAVVKSNNDYVFYLDGISIGEDSTTKILRPVNAPLEIGRAEGGNYFDGTIDEAKIYNRALSADEIREEYSHAPVGYWKFDEGTGTTASDSSGNSNHGTLINGPAWTSGRDGGALSFDGTDDYVDIIATTSLYNFPQMTIEAWINPKSDGGVVIDRGFYSSPYWTISVGNSMGGMRWNTGQTTNDQGVLQDTTNIPYSTWTHIALVLIGIDSTSHNATWYINGQKKTSAILPTGLNAITSTSNPLLIGKTSHPMYHGYFNGTIDEIRIYGRTLSQKEIKTLAGSDLVGYWRFDEGNGALVQDSSGSSNNGTLINGPTWVSGRCNKALSFDGVDDRVEVPSSSSLNITDQITIMGWFSLKSKIVNEGKGAGHSLAEKWNVYGVRIDSSGFHGYVSINGDPSAGELGAPMDPSINTWYCVAYTYDGAQSRVYVNGRLGASKTVRGKIDKSNLPLWIGANDGEGQFNGTIDEVRIYDRAFSASEIWTQYTKTPIATQTVTLGSGTSTTLTFTWNTTGFAKGNYTVWAYAEPVSGETYTANNNFTGGTVHVSIPGDIKGDDIVNILDAILLSGHYNEHQPWPHPTIDANIDINGDGIINLFDAIILSNNYLQHYP